MYRAVNDFLEHWKWESQQMQAVLDVLTDASLAQAVIEGHRTLGRMAWHICTTIPEMMAHTGLKMEHLVAPDAPVPSTAKEIARAYSVVAKALADEVAAKWDDKGLLAEDELYGERWKRGFTLLVLLKHQIHHRGQMTVLMRQAGLRVPGIYGPAMEEWAQYGAPAPEV